MDKVPDQKYLIRLRQILTKRFDKGELRTLCFDLGVAYDNLPGEGHADKARELIAYLVRRDRISELVRIGEQLRPDVSWGDTLEVIQDESPTVQHSPPEQLPEEEVDERREQAVGVTTARAKEDIGEFDVFLAHNSRDKQQVIALAEALKGRGLNPWLDIEQIPPGRWFQDIIQQVIPKVKSAAVIIGVKGLGKWQTLELRSFISQCVGRDIPVIPVLLPGVTKLPPELLFLQELSWVRFNVNIDETEALDNLEWGITGKRPQRRLK